jgi:hypothetical protein
MERVMTNVNTNAELARVALTLCGQAKIPADGKAIKSVLATLNWLEGIATGALLVTPAPQPKDLQTPAGK